MLRSEYHASQEPVRYIYPMRTIVASLWWICCNYYERIILTSCPKLPYPPHPHSVIAFTLHLSSPSNSRTPLPLSQSYALATTQYTRLRAIEEVAQLAREEERLVRMNERRLARVGGEAEGEEARFGEGEVEAAAVSEGRRAFVCHTTPFFKDPVAIDQPDRLNLN